MSIRLLPARAYAKAVTRAIHAAHSRVYVATYLLQAGQDSDDIITALVRAASRGVDVSVIADASTYHYRQGSLALSHVAAPHVQRIQLMTKRLRSAGVALHWVGDDLFFLYAGRTHSKWIVADDTVFCFGGINLDACLRTNTDYMLQFTDQRIADIIYREHQSIIRADALRTATVSSSYETSLGTVLIDGGLAGDSIIYRHAVKLVHSAKEITLVTQYCPTGTLARIMSRTPHALYYNPPATTDFLTKILITTSERRHKLASSYQRNAYLHAKYMIATDHSGQKTAITGSHNFIGLGGLLGTREIALQTTDERIITQLESFCDQYIA